MRHISIEGMDGVGKSTTCKALAKELGFQFVEKPLHYLLDEGDSVTNYRTLAKKINSNQDRNFTAWYYGLNNLFVYNKFKNDNIVTDRHVCSNYAWSGTEYNKDIYDLIIKKIGKPELTVILYASEETIAERLKKRNPEDKDLKRLHNSEMVYQKMIYFCEMYKLNYIVIDTASLTVEQTVEKIIEKMEE